MSSQDKLTILFLAANPADMNQLQLDEEMRSVDSALRMTEYWRHFDLRAHWAVRPSDLHELLLRYKPHIVHFSGHGSKTGEILLKADTGDAKPLAPDVLASLLAILKDNVRCVVLNACFSEQQAYAIAQHIDCVVGMSRAILDSSAIEFATAFYRGIGYGRSIQTAFDLGCNQIGLAGQGIVRRKMTLVSPKTEEEALHESEAAIPQLVSLRLDPEKIVLSQPSTDTFVIPDRQPTARKGITNQRELLLAVFALLLLAVIWSIIFPSGEMLSFRDFVGFIPAAVSLFGARRETQKRQAEKEFDPGEPVVRPTRPNPSLDSGIYGGLLGGAVTGLMMVLAYTAAAGWYKLGEIFVFATLVGLVFGALVQMMIVWFRHLNTKRGLSRFLFNEVTGGLAGGGAAGLLLGGLGGWYFELDRTLTPNVTLFAIAIVVGAICIPLGALYYDYRGNWQNTSRVLTVSAAITALVFLIAIAISRSQVPEILLQTFRSDDVVAIVRMAALLGLCAGSVVGGQVGLILRLYRLWDESNRHLPS
jgi:hypothetical protein